MIDPYQRALDQIDNLGRQGWRDRHGEGTVRHILLGLRVQNLLDRDALLAEMRGRGYDERALQRLDRFITKTYREVLYAASSDEGSGSA